MKILHIKGAHPTIGRLTDYSNEIYQIIESDHNRDIMEQIKEADMCIGVGRSLMDSVVCGKPVICGDNRRYNGLVSDGLLTSDIIEESLKFNFNGSRFRNELNRVFMDEQVRKYLLDFKNEDMELIYIMFKDKFDYKKIAEKILGEK